MVVFSFYLYASETINVSMSYLPHPSLLREDLWPSIHIQHMYIQHSIISEGSKCRSNYIKAMHFEKTFLSHLSCNKNPLYVNISLLYYHNITAQRVNVSLGLQEGWNSWQCRKNIVSLGVHLYKNQNTISFNGSADWIYTCKLFFQWKLFKLKFENSTSFAGVIGRLKSPRPKS